MDIDFQTQIATKSTEELTDIYLNSDQYQSSFITLVEKELNKRNANLENLKASNDLNSLHQLDKLATGRSGNQFYIMLGFISALLGGILGIIAGYTYSQSKHLDNLGNKYYVYDSKTRTLGRTMMIIGFFALLLILIWKFS